MITIREIAAIAGVSRSTVSLVLNNSPLVRQETREQVLQVIRDTGYVPNSNARNLSLRANKSLGIIILSDLKRSTSYDFSNSIGLYSLNIMRGITSRLSDTDYSVIIEYFSPDSPQGEPDAAISSDARVLLPKLIRERRVDGAFIVCGYCPEPFLSAMAASGIPFVTIAAGTPESVCDSVVSDPAEGIYIAASLLFQRGRRRPALITCLSFRSTRPRIVGFQRACEEHGVPFDEELLVLTGHNSGQSAYDAMQQALSRGLQPDAVVGSNPQLTVGGIRCLTERGYRIPEDISAVTYEDNALCSYFLPAITAVNIQKEKMGESAVELLLHRISCPDAPLSSVTIPSYLVERESV